MAFGMALFWIFIILKSGGILECSWLWLFLWIPVSLVYSYAAGRFSQEYDKERAHKREMELAFWKDKFMNSSKPKHL